MATTPTHDPKAESSIMAITPVHDPKAESSAMAAAAASDSLKAELEAAITAYKDQIVFMNPTRQEYDELFFKHKKIQARYEKVIAKLSSNQTTYTEHKRYFGSLSNALLTSTAGLRSSPRPITDLQTLTHATLMHDFKHASHTLTEMIFQEKRLDKIKDLFFELDHRLCEKCAVVFQTVGRDYKKLDQLHVEVLAAGKKLGKKPTCGGEEGNCVSCARIKAEVEKAEKAEVEKPAKADVEKAVKAEVEKAAKMYKGGNRKTGKLTKAKGKLEDIVEEEDLGDCAN